VFVGERSKPDEAGGERDHLLKALQETQRAYEKLALIGVSLALNVRFTPKADIRAGSDYVRAVRPAAWRYSLRFIRVGNFAARGCKAC